MMKRTEFVLRLFLVLAVAGVVTAQGKAAPGPVAYKAAVVVNVGTDPTVTELENTTGVAITITRIAAGQYRITPSSPVFTVGRTIYYTHYYNMGPSVTVQATMRCYTAEFCDLWLVHADPAGNSQYFYDGSTAGRAIPIVIEVYP